MDSDDRHLRFPSMDIRMKDPFYVNEQIKKLEEEQRNYKKMYDFLSSNLGDLAREVRDLRSDLDEERQKSDESRAKIDEISSNAKEAQQKVERLVVEVEKARGHVEESVETVATIDRPQTNSSARDLGRETFAGTHHYQ